MGSFMPLRGQPRCSRARMGCRACPPPTTWESYCLIQEWELHKAGALLDCGTALASVLNRQEAARDAHVMARAFRTGPVQKSAAGEAVAPAALIEAQAAVFEAAEAVGSFGDVIAAAERTLAKARSTVTVVLRQEVSRRRDLAQAAVMEADRRVQDASRDRATAQEALRQLTGAASQNGDVLRRLLEAETAAVS
jgi:hypothetical protein